MPAARRSTIGDGDRLRRALVDVGRELRSARLAHGLAQRDVAGATGVSQGQISMLERGHYRTASVVSIGRVALAVGLDLSVKLYPGGEPIRDRAHEALLARFRTAVGEAWSWAAEVPLPLPGDRRAWDRLLRGAGIVIAIEAETRPTDLQELQRRLALKKRDGKVDRLVLVLADSDWCRRLVRLNDIETSFPVAGRVALRAMQEGRDPGGDAVVFA